MIWTRLGKIIIITSKKIYFIQNEEEKRKILMQNLIITQNLSAIKALYSRTY